MTEAAMTTETTHNRQNRHSRLLVLHFVVILKKLTRPTCFGLPELLLTERASNLEVLSREARPTITTGKAMLR